MNFDLMSQKSKKHFVFSDKELRFIWGLYRQLIFCNIFMVAFSSCTVIVGLSSMQVSGYLEKIIVILEDRWHMPVTQINLSGIVGRTRKVEQWTDIFFLKFMDS